MKTVSLKIDELIFSETKKVLDTMDVSRNRYINNAIDYYNKIQKRKNLAERLKDESKMVREDSIKILKEFESFEYGS